MAVAEAAVATSSETVNTTSHDVSLPSGIVAGSLVLVFFAHDGSINNDIGWPDGWTPLRSDNELSAAGNGFEIAARFCDGTEGSTIVVTTTNSEQSVHRAVRLTGHHSAHLPEIAVAEGSSTTPDCPSLSPSWGSAEESLLYACFGQDNGNRTLTSAPAAYDATDVYATSPGGSGCALGVGHRNASVTSEDPGAYTISLAQDWVAATIAVRPAGVDEIPAPTDLGEVTNAASLTTVAAAPAGSRVVVKVWWYGTQTCTGATDNEEGLTWVVDAQERGTSGGDQNQAILSADAPSGLTLGAEITPTFSATPSFGPGIAASAYEGLEGGDTGYVDDVVTAITQDFNELWTSESVTSTGEGVAIGYSVVAYTPGDHRPIGSAEAHEWNTEGGQYAAVVYKILGGATTVALQGLWTTDVSFQQNIAIVYKKAAGGGAGAIDAGTAGTGATVPGADVAASGSVPLDADVAGAGATVPGADVAASGSVPLDADVAGTGATVPGADVAASGSATLSVDVAGAAAAVPGADLAPSGAASLSADVAGSGATVPGADVSGAASALDAGFAGTGATVPGADVAASGSAQLDADVAGTGATIPGSDLAASGSVSLAVDVAGAGAVVPGADLAAGVATLDVGVAGVGASVPGSDLAASGSAQVDAGVAGTGATVPGGDLQPSGAAPLAVDVAGVGASVPGADLAQVALSLSVGVAGTGATVPGADLWVRGRVWAVVEFAAAAAPVEYSPAAAVAEFAGGSPSVAEFDDASRLSRYASPTRLVDF